jgi:hypothetical protein
VIYQTLESGVEDADSQSCDDAARIALRRTFEGSAATLGIGTAENIQPARADPGPPLSVPSCHGALSPPRAVSADHWDVSGSFGKNLSSECRSDDTPRGPAGRRDVRL